MNENKPKLEGHFLHARPISYEIKSQLEQFPASPFKIDKNSLVFKLFAGLCVISCMGSFGYLAYNAFKYSNPPATLEEITVIKADLSPTKVVPQDPGGTQFSNQDKLIYTNLEDQNFKKKVARTNPEDLLEEQINKENVNFRVSKLEPPKSKKVAKKEVAEIKKVSETKIEAKVEAKVEAKAIPKIEANAVQKLVPTATIKKEPAKKTTVAKEQKTKATSAASVAKKVAEKKKQNASSPFDLINE